MQIILGSQSPRRKEILERFAPFSFLQVSSDYDEESVPFENDPEKYVVEIAKGKAAVLAKMFTDACIITADTIVFFEGAVFGKPKTWDEAHHNLSLFSGKWHQVYSGLTIQRGSKIFSQVEVSEVLFKSLTSREIDSYLKSIDWRDKAGGYTIASGDVIIEKVKGCSYNVMGLPINSLSLGLKEFGIRL